MKKILRAIILLTICCSVMIMPGCGSGTGSDSDSVSESGFDYKPIPEIRENFSQTVENLRTAEFDNLDFSNADFFDFPEIDSISLLALTSFEGKTVQELHDFFCMSLDTLVPGKIFDEQKMNEIVLNGERVNGELPNIKEFKPKPGLYSDPFLMLETEECFMDMFNGVLRWFDNGDLMRWCGEEGKPATEVMIDKTRPRKEIITDMKSTDKYELTDGEISVKDAAEFVNNYLETMNFSPYELSARCKAVSLNVVDIGRGKYGYNFIITPEYKNVCFDYYKSAGGMGVVTIENDYDNRDYDSMPGQIDMIETDKIYHFIYPAYDMAIEEAETYTSIITLEDAAKIVSEFYSKAMDLDVDRVQVVYLPCVVKDSRFCGEPCWKFILNSFSYSYNTLVNMHTGEVHVYVQEK